MDHPVSMKDRINLDPESPSTEPEYKTSLLSRSLYAIAGILLTSGSLVFGFVMSRKKVEDFTLPSTPLFMGDFILTERSGRRVSRADLNNQFVVTSFVFTSCGSICLGVNHQMAEVQRRLTEYNDVLMISLTVDPRTDTPVELVRFARRFGADPNRWLFLTGEKEMIYRLIEESFFPRPESLGKAASPSDFPTIQKVALIDQQGRVRAFFDGLNTNMPNALMDTIDRLRRGSTP